MKVVSVIGARPQFIKEAVVQRQLSKRDIKEVVVHTGQHYDENMSGVFFSVFGMAPPDYNLGIAAAGHGAMTGRMLIELESIFLKESPDVVLLYGDTNSTLAGALAAAKLKIPIAHVEAGLRQEPRNMPEEINRVITDRISTYLFAPSQLAVQNLQHEGISQNVHMTGDVMYDVFLAMRPSFNYALLSSLDLRTDDYVVLTLHRDFNVDNPHTLQCILLQVQELTKVIPVVFPMHPRTKKRVGEYGFEPLLRGVLTLEPIDYLQLMGLTEHAYKVLTDSGGYQKEAYFAGREACVIMPDTAWRELIDLGINVLCEGHDIFAKVMKAPRNRATPHIYGDGNAAVKITSLFAGE